MKNSQIIEKILEYHPNLPDYTGCDGYKAGNPEQECKGVAVALVPTMEVIRKAVKRDCNLLITHEPIYYQTPDFPEWKGNFGNQVQKEKEEWIKESGLTIWRDHDHMHVHKPDSIFTGVIKYLGWQDYFIGKPTNEPSFYYPFEIPEITVEQLGEFLVEKVGMNGLRYIGRKTDKIHRVAIVAHIYPNSFGKDEIKTDGYYHSYDMEIMKLMEEEEIQAIIPGEIIEWTVLSYIRDGIAQGKPMACYNLGHFNLEELGMKYAAEWIQELVGKELPVSYIPTGDTWQFIAPKSYTNR